MRAFFASRAALFTLERALSTAGGLVFTALLVRRETAEAAAGFLAAFAFASLLPPLFANACAPVAVRLWREAGPGAWAGFRLALFALSAAAAGAAALVADGGVGALMLGQAALAPAALAAAPFIAGDRYRGLLVVLIPVGLLGAGLRIGALLAGADLALIAALYVVEPALGGLLLARRAGAAAARPVFSPAVRVALRRAAPPLMLAMAAATLFWRSPVLLSAAFLPADQVVGVVLAMQIVTGLCLPANALCQSLFGPVARGEAAALGAGVLIAAAAGAGAVAATALFGPAAMAALYGPAGAAAAPLALSLAPLAGLAALWRMLQMAAGAAGRPLALAAAQGVALAGQGALAAALCVFPTAALIAAATPVSMAASALVAPFLAPGLRPVARTALAAAGAALTEAGARRRLLGLLFRAGGPAPALAEPGAGQRDVGGV